MTPPPEGIRIDRAARRLELTWADGRVDRLEAELLRVESPSAEVRGHGAEEKKLVRGKENVAIASAELTGNYALRLIFDDGHSSGLYTWTYLRELAERQDELMAAYRQALRERQP